MLGISSGPVLLPPWAVLALLVLVALLPVPLLAVWRADVLRRPVDVERPAWFAWFTRVQFLLLASALVTPVIAARLPIRLALVALGVRSPMVATVLAVMLGFAPLLVHFVLAVAASGNVERRLRGISLGVRERLARFAESLGVVAPLAAGGVLSFLAFTSGYGALATGLLLGGVLGTLVVASTRSALLGMAPQALTSGPLRERIAELASRAGTPVNQVLVLGAESMRMANAFAVHGGRVFLTDHLLSTLSRREVDVIVAHELAHLRESHPKKLHLTLTLAGMAAAPLLMLPVGPAAFLLPGLVGYAVFLLVSRRFEYVADRRAAEWTGDAAALVSGLVRLARINHYPVAWSRAREWTLTHPSTRRRAHALVAAGLLERDLAEALLAAPAEDPERWTGALPAAERVFGTPARTARSAAVSWAMLAACTLPPTALIAVASALAPGAPRALVLAAGGVIAFGAAWVTADVASVSGFPRWRRALAARLSPAEGEAFVGLAPHDPGVVYENYADWDLGFLALEPGVLRVRSELTTFVLARDRIVDVAVGADLPGWHRTSRVAVTWLGDDGARRTFVLRDAEARALHEFPARADRLAERLRRWRETPAPGRAVSAGVPPDSAKVSGTPLATLVAPATLPLVALLLALLAACFAGLSGLPLMPWGGAGAFDAFVAGFFAMIVLRLPVWRAAKRATPAPRAESLERAA